MKELVEYFGTARLINLPTRQDRLRLASNEFERAGAFLGPHGIQVYAAKIFTERAGFPHNPSVRGCFHSHTECIRDAFRQKKKSVLILEDDTALCSSIARLAPSIIAQLNSVAWDMVYFAYGADSGTLIANSRTEIIELKEVQSDITTCNFYAVNARIYARLLNHLDRVAAGVEGDQEFGPMPVDGAFNIFRRLNSDVRTFLLKPAIGWQRPSRSEITPKPIDNIRALRPVINIARRIKDRLWRWSR